MSLSSVSVSQIRAQVAAIYKKFPDARVIGIRASGQWTGNSHLQIGDAGFRVQQCDSVLQIRETLLDHQQAPEPLIILTNLEEGSLGQDLLARFMKRRIYGLQPWPILLEMFQARQAAPRLLNKKWLAEFLLEELPSQGFPAAASAMLDEETVWRIVLCNRMGFLTARPDTRDLLEWTLNTDHLALFRNAPEVVRNGICEWIIQSAGDAGRLIFQCIENEYGEDSLALGLTCLVIFSDETRPELKEAAIRMERLTGGKPVSYSAGIEWGKQAAKLIDQRTSQGELSFASGWLEKADRLLAELRVEFYAWQSKYSPRGYEQLLEAYAEKVLKALRVNQIKNIEEVNQEAKGIAAHRQAQIYPERVSRIEMSLRLLQWLRENKQESPADFVQAAQQYVAEGGHVDRARQAIARGDTNPVLAQAYQQLYEKVTKRRETQNEQFGRLLVNWTEMGSHGEGVLRIEEVLAKIVAPIAQREKVLLLVIDGMSYAVFSELVQDIQAKGWQSLAPENEPWPLPVIAALPTVTEVSRTSLLCGKLAKGNSSDEVAGFKSNPDLLMVTKAKHSPILFHKGNLTVGGSSVLTAEVKQEIESERRKIVGAVINAIDDNLAKGEQLNIPWVLHHLPVLQHLLESAWNSARVVIITSDHGHILEKESSYRKSESGERYRAADSAPQADECLVSGSRVLFGAEQKIIAPWAENVRYGKKKHGYHGGITPQECIVPLAVLTRANASIARWDSSLASLPRWWVKS